MTTMWANNLLLIAGVDPVGPSTTCDFDARPDTTFDVDEIFIADIVSLFDGSLESDETHLNGLDKTIISLVPNPLKDQPEIVISSPLTKVSPYSSCSDIAAAGVATDKHSYPTISSDGTRNGIKSNDICVVASAASAPLAAIPATTSFDQIQEEQPAKAVKREGSLMERSTNPKKRKLSSVPSVESETEGSGVAAGFELDENAKRERNRFHARRSRQRKKAMTDSLKISLEELKAENTKLREQMYAAIGQHKTNSLVTSKLASLPTEQNKFISALKQPENRVMDSEALEFLQGLRKKISAPQKPLQIVA